MRMLIAALIVSTGLTAAIARESARKSQAVAFTGARILTATGSIFDPGTLVVRGGKITAVGPQAEVAVPEGAEIRDLAGKVIIPGLVDSHSHLGVYSRPAVSANSDGNEMTGPVQGIVRALDSLNPFDPGIRMANAGGVTTANIMPGSGNVIGGQTIYVKLRGYTPEQMWIASETVYGGLKMANGENPKRSYGSRGKAPGTRMKVAALQRAEFIRAQEYQQKWIRHRQKLASGEEAAPPEIDLGLEPLVEVLEKKRTVHFHTHRADDILTVLRLRKEFDFELVIQHGTEVYKVLDEVAQAGVPVSLTIVDSPGGKAEVVDFIEEAASEMVRKGIKVLVNTDDPITESRFLLRTAAATVRGGLPPETALKCVTLWPAQAMRLDDRIGSLERGKDADLAILSGEPFSVYTRVLETYIDGQRVFELNDQESARYQTGSFAVARPAIPPALFDPIDAAAAANAPAPPAKAKTVNEDSTEFLIFAGRIHTVSGAPIDQAVLHVKDGRIVAAGPRRNMKLPGQVPVLTAAEVTPGLIDAYSVVPLNGEYNTPADQDADEKSDPNQADVRVLDGFNPAEPLMRHLLEQGITVIHACPGRSNVIGGQTGVFRTHGRSADAMAIRFPYGLLFNLGVSPKESYAGQRPGTRMGTAALIREQFAQAINYGRKKSSAADAASRPPLNLKHEAVSQALEGKMKSIFVAHRADDLLTALRMTDEYKLQPVVALASEGYLIANELKKAQVPVIVHPTMQRVGDLETFHSYLGNAGVLADREIPVAVSSGVEGYVPKSRVVRWEAAMAGVYGLGMDRALRAVTLDAARILGIDNRYGSLEKGKVADLVLYDGDPFEHATHVTHVFVEGKLVYERASRPTIPLAERMLLSLPEIPCCLGF